MRIVNHQPFHTMLRDISSIPRDFVDGNPIDVQCGLVPSKNGLGNDLCIPRYSNVLSSIVKAHFKGKTGSFWAVENVDNGMNQAKRILVVGNSVQLDSGWINHFNVSIVNGKVWVLGQNFLIIRLESVHRVSDV